MPCQKDSLAKWQFEKQGEIVRILRKVWPIKKPEGQEYGGLIKIADQKSEVENDKLKVVLTSMVYFYWYAICAKGMLGRMPFLSG